MKSDGIFFIFFILYFSSIIFLNFSKDKIGEHFENINLKKYKIWAKIFLKTFYIYAVLSFIVLYLFGVYLVHIFLLL